MISKRILGYLVPYILPLIIAACNQPEMKNIDTFDLQGHRGCRGLMPENTVPAMLKAVDLGVNTLELDVVITKDSQVVLSHEPVMSDLICLDRNGERMDEEASAKLNIFQMTYEEVKGYDCGSKIHPSFVDQEKMVLHKPLLKDVFESVDSHLKDGQSVGYNIEIKSTPDGDDIFHPGVAIFCELLMDVLKTHNRVDVTTVQSFDIRPLQYLHKTYPEVKLAFLSESLTASWESEIEQLGFAPDIYSPYFLKLSSEKVKAIQTTGMKVIPWTVNEAKDIQTLLEYRVDGIITDYPSRVTELITATVK